VRSPPKGCGAPCALLAEPLAAGLLGAVAARCPGPGLLAERGRARLSGLRTVTRLAGHARLPLLRAPAEAAGGRSLLPLLPLLRLRVLLAEPGLAGLRAVTGLARGLARRLRGEQLPAEPHEQGRDRDHRRAADRLQELEELALAAHTVGPEQGQRGDQAEDHPPRPPRPAPPS